MTEEAVRGRLVGPQHVIDDGVVVVRDDTIVDVRPADDTDDASTGLTVLPGLVDIHCHGGGGASFTIGDPDEIAQAAEHHLRHGTTALVASMVTDRHDRMVAGITAAAMAVDAGRLVGIHLEGPFLSQERCGAQDPAFLRSPDVDALRGLVEAGRGHVLMMTVAPELDGAGPLLDALDDRGVVIAVGHTTADHATTLQALSRGGVATHLFNGMPGWHHREPGPVAGALAAAAQGTARVELIADGVHLADETVRTVFDLLDEDRVLLVTDAMAAAGMPDGRYRLGPQEVEVRDGVARLTETATPSIAGGTSRLLEDVARTVRAGVDLGTAVRAASSNPAEALGIGDRHGSLRAGNRADLVLVADDWAAHRVMQAGTWVT